MPSDPRGLRDLVADLAERRLCPALKTIAPDLRPLFSQACPLCRDLGPDCLAETLLEIAVSRPGLEA